MCLYVCVGYVYVSAATIILIDGTIRRNFLRTSCIYMLLSCEQITGVNYSSLTCLQRNCFHATKSATCLK
jgi:hypothetical protein